MPNLLKVRLRFTGAIIANKTILTSCAIMYGFHEYESSLQQEIEGFTWPGIEYGAPPSCKYSFYEVCYPVL